MTAPGANLMALLDWLARRRVAVGALSAAIIVFAGVALSTMPLQLLPEIRYPQIRVITDARGQTSRVIEESVNEPIEAALASTPGIVRLESRSGDGRSYIDLFFSPGYNLDRALRDVTQAVQQAQAQIPAGFPEPRIFAVATTEEPALEIVVGSAVLSAPEIRQRLRGSLLPRLRAIPGVQAVFMGREEIPELVAEIDPVLQAASGVHLDAIEAVLLDATRPPPSSTMRTTEFEGLVVLGSTDWVPDQLEARPVPVVGSDQAVPLGAFARIHAAASEEHVRARLDGRPAVQVTVYRSPRAHALRMARQARAVLDELGESGTFAGMEATILFDDAVVTRSAVWSVVTAAVAGAALAILLLFFTLGHRRYTPLVAVIVATSLSASIIVLAIMGQTLNLLTLAGLLLSVGLGLDYSIIYFNELDRQAPGTDRPHLRAMVRIAVPLLGALLTTLAAVTPFLLVKGMIPLLFRPLIWTVAVAAVSCFVFALVLLPVFARAESAVRPAGRLRFPEPPARWFRARRPVYLLGTVAALAAILLLGGRALPFEVLPVVDDGFVEGGVIHPAGIPNTELDEIVRAAEARLMDVPGTEAVFSTVGGYFRNGMPTHRPGRADFMVRVNTGEGGSSVAWARRARETLAGMDIPALSVSFTTPRIRGVQTRLADADLIVVLTREDGDLLALTEIESRVVAALRGVPGLMDVRRLRSGVSPRWLAEPRYAELAATGVTPEALGRSLAYALEGKILRQRMLSGEPLVLRARYDRRTAGGPHQLQQVRIPSTSGADVLLADVVDFRLVEEPMHIERREGQRVIRVAGQLDPAGPGAARVERAVRAALEAAELPPGVGWWLEGELDALRETSRTFGIALGLALLLVLTLLVVQYSSLSLALAGFITIPLSGAGAVMLLGVLGRPLDAMVLAGLLIAVGIVANNVILVLSQARAAAEESEALTLPEALANAARDRLRPITLTVLSTVLGMSPLLLGGAQVFGLLQPLAIALTGALLLSVPLTTLLLPGLATVLAGAGAGRGDRLAAPGSPAD